MPDDRLTPPRGSRTDEWSRSDWLRYADRILAGARVYASPGHARITPPGAEGGYGRDVDGLEGFARTFLLAGFRLAGERGAGERGAGEGSAGMDELADWYARGIATGTDPASPERWVRLDEHPQAKVEAASLALILDLTRPWIWDRLAPGVQERVVRYLSPAVGDPTYPRINWVWFRLVVQTFLRSVGGPWSAQDMADDLDTHDTFRRADGWMSDGPQRAYDHYTGWALHLYPTLWARMAGAADLAAARRERDVAALDRFLGDALALVGADGSPLLQGRSLIYRFAAAAPFWVGVLAGVPSLTPGQLRYAAHCVVRHFAERNVPDEHGLLTLGWHRPWPPLAQAYSGPSSPYWATKGLLGIALPADHPVWTDAARPLPVAVHDTLRAIRAPGWVVCGTRADGIVRVVNHGTDHAVAGSDGADSPLYARIGYSTATAPALDESAWVDPVDQSVVLVDSKGRSTHRSGMRTLASEVDGQVGVAGSRAAAHWVAAQPGQRDHGSGRRGHCSPAGLLTVFSLVRGPWELRLSRVDRLADTVDPALTRLRVGGWAVSGHGASETSPGSVVATGGRLVSRLSDVPTGTGLPLAGTPGCAVRDHGGPLGDPTRVPWLEYPVEAGRWIATLVQLSAAEQAADQPVCQLVLDAAEYQVDVRVDWPDGVRTHTSLLPHTARTGSLDTPDSRRAPGERPIAKETV